MVPNLGTTFRVTRILQAVKQCREEGYQAPCLNQPTEKQFIDKYKSVGIAKLLTQKPRLRLGRRGREVGAVIYKFLHGHFRLPSLTTSL